MNIKKPFNPIKKLSFNQIVAPVQDEDTTKIATLFSFIDQGNISDVKKFILTNRIKLTIQLEDESVLHRVILIDKSKLGENRKLEFIEYLIANGANINTYNKYNISPLHLAVQMKYSKIVKYLLDNGANVNAITSEGLTPLHMALLLDIDNCPSDYNPESLIPKPTTKDVDANEITNIILKAIMEQEKVQISSDIIELDTNGNPKNINNFDTRIIKKDFEDKMKPIVSLVDGYFNVETKIITNIINKKLKNKTSIETIDIKQIISELAHVEIEKLKNKFVIKQGFIETSDDILKENNEFADLDNKLLQEQNKIIKVIITDIDIALNNFVKHIIGLKLQDYDNYIMQILNESFAELQVFLQDLGLEITTIKEIYSKSFIKYFQDNDVRKFINEIIKVSYNLVQVTNQATDSKINDINNYINSIETDIDSQIIKAGTNTERVHITYIMRAAALSEAALEAELLYGKLNNQIFPTLTELEINKQAAEKAGQVARDYIKKLGGSVSEQSEIAGIAAGNCYLYLAVNVGGAADVFVNGSRAAIAIGFPLASITINHANPANIAVLGLGNAGGAAANSQSVTDAAISAAKKGFTIKAIHDAAVIANPAPVPLAPNIQVTDANLLVMLYYIVSYNNYLNFSNNAQAAGLSAAQAARVAGGVEDDIIKAAFMATSAFYMKSEYYKLFAQMASHSLETYNAMTTTYKMVYDDILTSDRFKMYERLSRGYAIAQVDANANANAPAFFENITLDYIQNNTLNNQVLISNRAKKAAQNIMFGATAAAFQVFLGSDGKINAIETSGAIAAMVSRLAGESLEEQALAAGSAAAHSTVLAYYYVSLQQNPHVIIKEFIPSNILNQAEQVSSSIRDTIPEYSKFVACSAICAYNAANKILPTTRFQAAGAGATLAGMCIFTIVEQACLLPNNEVDHILAFFGVSRVQETAARAANVGGGGALAAGINIKLNVRDAITSPISDFLTPKQAGKISSYAVIFGDGSGTLVHPAGDIYEQLKVSGAQAGYVQGFNDMYNCAAFAPVRTRGDRHVADNTFSINTVILARSAGAVAVAAAAVANAAAIGGGGGGGAAIAVIGPAIAAIGAANIGLARKLVRDTVIINTVAIVGAGAGADARVVLNIANLYGKQYACNAATQALAAVPAAPAAAGTMDSAIVNTGDFVGRNAGMASHQAVLDAITRDNSLGPVEKYFKEIGFTAGKATGDFRIMHAIELASRPIDYTVFNSINFNYIFDIVLNDEGTIFTDHAYALAPAPPAPPALAHPYDTPEYQIYESKRRISYTASGSRADTILVVLNKINNIKQKITNIPFDPAPGAVLVNNSLYNIFKHSGFATYNAIRDINEYSQILQNLVARIPNGIAPIASDDQAYTANNKLQEMKQYFDILVHTSAHTSSHICLRLNGSASRQAYHAANTCKLLDDNITFNVMNDPTGIIHKILSLEGNRALAQEVILKQIIQVSMQGGIESIFDQATIDTIKLHAGAILAGFDAVAQAVIAGAAPVAALAALAAAAAAVAQPAAAAAAAAAGIGVIGQAVAGAVAGAGGAGQNVIISALAALALGQSGVDILIAAINAGGGGQVNLRRALIQAGTARGVVAADITAAAVAAAEVRDLFNLYNMRTNFNHVITLFDTTRFTSNFDYYYIYDLVGYVSAQAIKQINGNQMAQALASGINTVIQYKPIAANLVLVAGNNAAALTTLITSDAGAARDANRVQAAVVAGAGAGLLANSIIEKFYKDLITRTIKNAGGDMTMINAIIAYSRLPDNATSDQITNAIIPRILQDLDKKYNDKQVTALNASILVATIIALLDINYFQDEKPLQEQIRVAGDAASKCIKELKGNQTDQIQAAGNAAVNYAAFVGTDSAVQAIAGAKAAAVEAVVSIPIAGLGGAVLARAHIERQQAARSAALEIATRIAGQEIGRIAENIVYTIYEPNIIVNQRVNVLAYINDLNNNIYNSDRAKQAKFAAQMIALLYALYITQPPPVYQTLLDQYTEAIAAQLDIIQTNPVNAELIFVNMHNNYNIESIARTQAIMNALPKNNFLNFQIKEQNDLFKVFINSNKDIIKYQIPLELGLCSDDYTKIINWYFGTIYQVLINLWYINKLESMMNANLITIALIHYQIDKEINYQKIINCYQNLKKTNTIIPIVILLNIINRDYNNQLVEDNNKNLKITVHSGNANDYSNNDELSQLLKKFKQKLFITNLETVFDISYPNQQMISLIIGYFKTQLLESTANITNIHRKYISSSKLNNIILRNQKNYEYNNPQWLKLREFANESIIKNNLDNSKIGSSYSIAKILEQLGFSIDEIKAKITEITNTITPFTEDYILTYLCRMLVISLYNKEINNIISIETILSTSVISLVGLTTEQKIGTLIIRMISAIELKISSFDTKMLSQPTNLINYQEIINTNSIINNIQEIPNKIDSIYNQIKTVKTSMPTRDFINAIPIQCEFMATNIDKLDQKSIDNFKQVHEQYNNLFDDLITELGNFETVGKTEWDYHLPDNPNPNGGGAPPPPNHILEINTNTKSLPQNSVLLHGNNVLNIFKKNSKSLNNRILFWTMETNYLDNNTGGGANVIAPGQQYVKNRPIGTILTVEWYLNMIFNNAAGQNYPYNVILNGGISAQQAQSLVDGDVNPATIMRVENENCPKYEKLKIAIEKFKDLIYNNQNAAPIQNLYNTSQIFIQAAAAPVNLLLKKIIDSPRDLGSFSQLQAIQSIYQDNINYLLGYIYYIFNRPPIATEVNQPLAAVPAANRYNINILGNAMVVQQIPLKDYLKPLTPVAVVPAPVVNFLHLNPNITTKSFEKLVDDQAPNSNFDHYIKTTSSRLANIVNPLQAPEVTMHKWLFNLHAYYGVHHYTDGQGLLAAQPGGPVPVPGAANPRTISPNYLHEDNGMTQIDRTRESITMVPHGLVNLEQGLLVTIIKQISYEANLLFNKVEDTAASYNTNQTGIKLKRYIMLYLQVINVFYYFQLFSACPDKRLYDLLLVQITTFNTVFDEAATKCGITLKLDGDYGLAILKCTEFIIEQKRIRSKSMARILSDNMRLFNRVYHDIILSQQIYINALQAQKISTISFNSLELFKKYKKQIMPIGNNYSKVYYPNTNIFQDTDLLASSDYRITIESSKDINFIVKLNKSQALLENNEILPTTSLEIKKYLDEDVRININLEDYNWSTFFLSSIIQFNELKDLYQKFDVEENNKKLLGFINKSIMQINPSSANTSLIIHNTLFSTILKNINAELLKLKDSYQNVDVFDTLKTILKQKVTDDNVIAHFFTSSLQDILKSINITKLMQVITDVISWGFNSNIKISNIIYQPEPESYYNMFNNIIGLYQVSVKTVQTDDYSQDKIYQNIKKNYKIILQNDSIEELVIEILSKTTDRIITPVHQDLIRTIAIQLNTQIIHFAEQPALQGFGFKLDINKNLSENQINNIIGAGANNIIRTNQAAILAGLPALVPGDLTTACDQLAAARAALAALAAPLPDLTFKEIIIIISIILVKQRVLLSEYDGPGLNDKINELANYVKYYVQNSLEKVDGIKLVLALDSEQKNKKIENNIIQIQKDNNNIDYNKYQDFNSIQSALYILGTAPNYNLIQQILKSKFNLIQSFCIIIEKRIKELFIASSFDSNLINITNLKDTIIDSAVLILMRINSLFKQMINQILFNQQIQIQIPNYNVQLSASINEVIPRDSSLEEHNLFLTSAILYQTFHTLFDNYKKFQEETDAFEPKQFLNMVQTLKYINKFTENSNPNQEQLVSIPYKGLVDKIDQININEYHNILAQIITNLLLEEYKKKNNFTHINNETYIIKYKKLPSEILEEQQQLTNSDNLNFLITDFASYEQKKEFYKTFINGDFVKILIALFFKEIKTKYYFNNQNFYIEAINKLKKTLIGFTNIDEVLKNHIYSIYDKITIDFMNNLISVSVYNAFDQAYKFNIKESNTILKHISNNSAMSINFTELDKKSRQLIIRQTSYDKNINIPNLVHQKEFIIQDYKLFDHDINILTSLNDQIQSSIDVGVINLINIGNLLDQGKYVNTIETDILKQLQEIKNKIAQDYPAMPYNNPIIIALNTGSSNLRTILERQVLALAPVIPHAKTANDEARVCESIITIIKDEALAWVNNPVHIAQLQVDIEQYRANRTDAFRDDVTNRITNYMNAIIALVQPRIAQEIAEQAAQRRVLATYTFPNQEQDNIIKNIIVTYIQKQIFKLYSESYAENENLNFVIPINAAANNDLVAHFQATMNDIFLTQAYNNIYARNIVFNQVTQEYVYRKAIETNITQARITDPNAGDTNTIKAFEFNTKSLYVYYAEIFEKMKLMTHQSVYKSINKSKQIIDEVHTNVLIRSQQTGLDFINTLQYFNPDPDPDLFYQAFEDHNLIIKSIYYSVQSIYEICKNIAIYINSLYGEGCVQDYIITDIFEYKYEQYKNISSELDKEEDNTSVNYKIIIQKLIELSYSDATIYKEYYYSVFYFGETLLQSIAYSDINITDTEPIENTKKKLKQLERILYIKITLSYIRDVSLLIKKMNMIIQELINPAALVPAVLPAVLPNLLATSANNCIDHCFLIRLQTDIFENFNLNRFIRTIGFFQNIQNHMQNHINDKLDVIKDMQLDIVKRIYKYSEIFSGIMTVYNTQIALVQGFILAAPQLPVLPNPQVLAIKNILDPNQWQNDVYLQQVYNNIKYNLFSQAPGGGALVHFHNRYALDRDITIPNAGVRFDNVARVAAPPPALLADYIILNNSNILYDELITTFVDLKFNNIIYVSILHFLSLDLNLLLPPRIQRLQANNLEDIYTKISITRIRTAILCIHDEQLFTKIIDIIIGQEFITQTLVANIVNNITDYDVLNLHKYYTYRLIYQFGLTLLLAYYYTTNFEDFIKLAKSILDDFNNEYTIRIPRLLNKTSFTIMPAAAAPAPDYRRPNNAYILDGTIFDQNYIDNIVPNIINKVFHYFTTELKYLDKQNGLVMGIIQKLPLLPPPPLPLDYNKIGYDPDPAPPEFPVLPVLPAPAPVNSPLSYPLGQAIFNTELKLQSETIGMARLLKNLINTINLNLSESGAGIQATEDSNSIVSIYLPEKNYEFNSNSLRSKLITELENDNNGETLANAINKIDEHPSLNFKLVEDEEYDLYKDDDFKTDIITITKEGIAKYYPIFYSDNYINRETSKECVIIDYGLIINLINKGSNIYIKDQTGKIIIDYILEGRMIYLLDYPEIKNKLFANNNESVKLSILDKAINNELLHCKIFSKTPTSFDFVENYQETLIAKLKDMEELKTNIPINIKYIFNVFLLLQNIYWFRLLNKTFHSDQEYLNFFDIHYDPAIPPAGPKLDAASDWKEIITNIMATLQVSSDKLINKRANKLNIRKRNILETNKGDKTRDTVSVDIKINKLRNLQMMIGRIPPNIKSKNEILQYKLSKNENKLTRDKSIAFFREIFNNLNNDNQSIIYTYLWERISKDPDKKFYIHLQIFKQFNKLLQEKIINIPVKQTSIFSPKQLDVYTKNESLYLIFNTKIKQLMKYMEPITKFIDGRFFENILEDNSLLLFQSRTIIHILSTFLGSNMILFLERLLFNELKTRFIGNNDKEIFLNVHSILEEAKEYICSDLLENGNLSYDFLRVFMNFKLSENDINEDIGIEDIFYKIITKILNGKINNGTLFSGIEDKSIIINNIQSNILPYYLALYKEIAQQLLNFSDSYYRYIKNQYLGICMLEKIMN